MVRPAVLACALCAALPLSARPPQPAQKLARSVTIYRDTWGVPHIYGPTDASVAFGLMYAQAEDNFWQLEDDYIRALGRAAELYGPERLPADIAHRAFEITRRAREEYGRLDAGARAICDAFAAGLNYYLERNPKAQPRLISRFEPWHILAFQFSVAARVGVPGLDLRPPQPEPDEGSNMWAVSPRKTAAGRALLLINPHVGFFGGGQRYEAHLRSGEGLHVSGFAILGTPYIRSGYNERLGWSHTNNYADTVDVYRLTFDDPANPLAYRYAGGYRTAVEWSEDIAVRVSGAVQTRRVRLRKAHYGPVFRAGDGQWYAIRTALLDRPGILQQRWAMARARSLAEFKTALARLSLTGSNTMYADRQGNIFYVHGNAIPRRAAGFDWSRPVDGSNPEAEWQGFHRPDELPQMINPESGYLQNCNSTPFLMSGEDLFDRSRYPAYMAPEQDNLRAEQSRRILERREKFTFDDWARAGLDTTILSAEKELPPLFTEWERVREGDPERARGIAEAISELKAWDHVGTVKSAAMTLFLRWRQQSPRDLAALERVCAGLERDFGTWRVPWGEVNRLQRVHTSGNLEPFLDHRPSVPVPGAPGAAGIIFVFNARPAAGQKRSYGYSGNSYVSVAEFGNTPRALSLLVFGQSADRNSPNYFDQARLYSEQKFKPAWFHLADVKKNARRVYHPGQ
jgi:penicillin amidase